MRAINIANQKSRNAQVGFDVKARKSEVVMGCEDGMAYSNVRLLKSTVQTDLDSLIDQHGDDLTDIIIGGDPEIDMEHTGMKLGKVRKVFIDPKGKVAYRVLRENVFYTPEGEEKEVRKFQTTEANINTDSPLRWTGKLIPKDKAVRMFAFTRKYQIRHVNGLTYDFLYDMAKQLADKNSMMLMGGGAKGAGPVVMSSGGTPYRAFLEGRVDGDKYCLIMHLTNLELKSLNKDADQ